MTCQTSIRNEYLGPCQTYTMETWPIVSIHDQDTSVILDLFTSVYFYHSLVQRITATKNLSQF